MSNDQMLDFRSHVTMRYFSCRSERFFLRFVGLSTTVDDSLDAFAVPGTRAEEEVRLIAFGIKSWIFSKLWLIFFDLFCVEPES
jgi:hypothetical protein